MLSSAYHSISKMLQKIIVLCILVCLVQAGIAQKPVDYVDNFIGVRDANSSCVLGPTLPQGSINPSPHTAPGNTKYDMDCYVMGQPIRGFGQLHVSGTGWGKYGTIFLSPQVGLATGETEHDSQKDNETAKPYEYGVTLTRYGISVAVTPAFHSAIYQFTFPATDSADILLDVTHSLNDIATGMKSNNNKFIDGKISFTNTQKTELTGFGNYIGGFSDGPYKVYFCMRLSKAPNTTGTWLNGKINADQTTQISQKDNDRIGAYVQYKTTNQEKIYVKIAVSLKSVEQATEWLNEEIPNWNYQLVKNKAKQQWNKELSKITVKGGTEKAKQIFYTAAYHASVMPRNRTNDIEGFGSDTPMWDDHLAVWDTWRTLYPLKVFTNPEMVAGTINSFIARWKKNGKVKDAFVAAKDKSDDQGGNDIDNIIADAFVKKVKGVNWADAYELMKHQANNERLGIKYIRPDSGNMYKTLGWIPAGKMSNSITLEYAYNDFCAAQMAQQLGTTDEFNTYLKRSKQWVNLWNADAESDGYRGFIVPKRLGGNFINIDAKKNWGSWKEYFYEGNSWTYSYFVPHQLDTLVTLSGGKDMFAKKLQYAFERNLIDYGNEPAFLAVHAFHYANRSDLASFYMRKLMKERFTLDGYSENDDSGAMSSWFIFSTMGFFPNAGQNIYYLTGGSFPSVSLKMGNGKTLKVISKNASDENIYIQSCKINGKPWQKFYFTHDDIMNGGTIEFVMGSKPLVN